VPKLGICAAERPEPGLVVYPCCDGPLEVPKQAGGPPGCAARRGDGAGRADCDGHACGAARGPVSPGVAVGGGVDPRLRAGPVPDVAGGTWRDQHFGP
jgi:hypothetical protein